MRKPRAVSAARRACSARSNSTPTAATSLARSAGSSRRSCARAGCPGSRRGSLRRGPREARSGSPRGRLGSGTRDAGEVGVEIALVKGEPVGPDHEPVDRGQAHEEGDEGGSASCRAHRERRAAIEVGERMTMRALHHVAMNPATSAAGAPVQEQPRSERGQQPEGQVARPDVAGQVQKTWRSGPHERGHLLAPTEHARIAALAATSTSCPRRPVCQRLENGGESSAWAWLGSWTIQCGMAATSRAELPPLVELGETPRHDAALARGRPHQPFRLHGLFFALAAPAPGGSRCHAWPCRRS